MTIKEPHSEMAKSKCKKEKGNNGERSQRVREIAHEIDKNVRFKRKHTVCNDNVFRSVNRKNVCDARPKICCPYVRTSI